jgi:cobalt transporter subunit CbtB
MIHSPSSLEASRSEALVRAWQSAVLVLLGVVVLLCVGFARLPQVHDAAHDTRHSFNFPCH